MGFPRPAFTRVKFVVIIKIFNCWRTSVNDMKQLVEQALAKIRPMLQRDGGDIELVEVNDGVVKVRLTGACKGCPMSQMTLKQGVEKLLLKEVPGLKEVQAV
jgi:Fe-S cluster biogenesis protein NfuA